MKLMAAGLKASFRYHGDCMKYGPKQISRLLVLGCLELKQCWDILCCRSVIFFSVFLQGTYHCGILFRFKNKNSGSRFFSFFILRQTVYLVHRMFICKRK